MVYGSLSCVRRSPSISALAREYAQCGFSSGVASVMGRFRTGFLYADAELMKTYCPQCPVNSPMSRAIAAGANIRNWQTTSKSWRASLRVCRIVLDVAGDEPNSFGNPALFLPRLNTVTSWPSRTVSWMQSKLISPEPPTYRIRME